MNQLLILANSWYLFIWLGNFCFYKTKYFITAFRDVHHYTAYLPSLIQFVYMHYISGYMTLHGDTVCGCLNEVKKSISGCFLGAFCSLFILKGCEIIIYHLVSIVLGYGLDNVGSMFQLPAGAGNFSLHHCIQNGSGAHPALWWIGTMGSVPGGKATGAWSWPLTSI